jgi:hypothetical protein
MPPVPAAGLFGQGEPDRRNDGVDLLIREPWCHLVDVQGSGCPPTLLKCLQEAGAQDHRHEARTLRRPVTDVQSLGTPAIFCRTWAGTGSCNCHPRSSGHLEFRVEAARSVAQSLGTPTTFLTTSWGVCRRIGQNGVFQYM